MAVCSVAAPASSGQVAAADLLRDRVLAAIADTYPTLAAEARRQPTGRW